MKLEKRDKVGFCVVVPDRRAYGIKNKKKLERVTVELPAETMQRLKRNKVGAMGISVAALLDFAMDTLDKNGEVLRVEG